MNPFFAHLVRGIEAEARSWGHQVIRAKSDESAEQVEGLVKALIQRIDGLIIGPIMEEDRSVLSLSQTGIPVVLVDRDATTTNHHRILVDNLSGTTRAIDHPFPVNDCGGTRLRGIPWCRSGRLRLSGSIHHPRHGSRSSCGHSPWRLTESALHSGGRRLVNRPAATAH